MKIIDVIRWLVKMDPGAEVVFNMLTVSDVQAFARDNGFYINIEQARWVLLRLDNKSDRRAPVEDLMELLEEVQGKR